MSPWEVIGWAIAVPMVLFTALFVFALIGSMFRVFSKPPENVTDHPTKRRLRLVEDE